MATLEPRVDFADLTDDLMADLAFDQAQRTFDGLLARGLPSSDSMTVVIGTYDDGTWTELGDCGFGEDFEEFEPNVHPANGKLATALEFERTSAAANYHYGEYLPEGPQRFTGGIYHIEYVKTVERGWMTRVFAGAASGVQGHFDQEVVSAAVMHLAALWALKMLALYGKPAS